LENGKTSTDESKTRKSTRWREKREKTDETSNGVRRLS